MKTYVLELDGTPKLAFRATGIGAAVNWPKRGIGRWCVRDYQGVLTVRLASIPEQAEWRAHSVGMEELDDEARERYPDDAPDSELKPGSYGSGPDTWVLVLDQND
jgi:hypothetical protein